MRYRTKAARTSLWTRNADLLLADGQGPDMAALHDWWLKFG